MLSSLDDGLSWPRSIGGDQGYAVAESVHRLIEGHTDNLYEDVTAVLAFILFIVLSWLAIFNFVYNLVHV